MVLMWDMQTRSRIGNPLEGHTAPVTSVSFSPDGAFLYSASWDGTIRCWESSSGKPVGHPLTGHTDVIWSLAISPDGCRIVTGSWDNSIRIWDTRAFTLDVDQSFVSGGLRGADRCPAEIPEDGWIRTTEGGLLLWIPREHRFSMYSDMSLLCISQGKDRRIRVDWDRLRHGEDWTSIRDLRQF